MYHICHHHQVFEIIFCDLKLVLMQRTKVGMMVLFNKHNIQKIKLSNILESSKIQNSRKPRKLQKLLQKLQVNSLIYCLKKASFMNDISIRSRSGGVVRIMTYDDVRQDVQTRHFWVDIFSGSHLSHKRRPHMSVVNLLLGITNKNHLARCLIQLNFIPASLLHNESKLKCKMWTFSTVFVRQYVGQH